MTRIILTICVVFGVLCSGEAQSDTARTQTGGWAYVEIENGDTLYSMSLKPVTISARRIFKSKEDRRKYYLYKRCAIKAYPFAMQALELYEKVEDETEDMSKRKRKKYLRKTKRSVKSDFKSQMKKLTKTQGYILIKMIERQTGKPFYEIIKETQGGFNAAYWHNLGKIWGYDLKDKYEVGKDGLLDEILLDYDFGDALYQY